MKKLFIGIAVLLCLSFSYTPVATTVYSGDIITSAGTTEVELQFGDMRTGVKEWVTITVLSDSIRFSSGRTITNAKGARCAGEKFAISVTNGVTNAPSGGGGNLRYKANSSGDKFVVTH